MNRQQSEREFHVTQEHLQGFTVMDDTRGQLLKISEKLQYLYKGKLSLETVERYVFESYELLDAKSDVKVYLLPLAERFSRDRLNALMKSENPSTSTTVDVLADLKWPLGSWPNWAVIR